MNRLFDLVRGQTLPKIEEVKEILRQPNLNINRPDINNLTVIEYLIQWNCPSTLTEILKYPGINPNQTGYCGIPLSYAVHRANPGIVNVLLSDPRVIIDSAVIYTAIMEGSLSSLELILISGKPFQITRNFPSDHTFEGTYQLLQRYIKDPDQTTYEIKLKVRSHGDEYSGYVFGLIVYLSDDYLRIIERVTQQPKVRRFFKITQELPMDLQMVICNRLVGSDKNIISTSLVEKAFRTIAKDLQTS